MQPINYAAFQEILNLVDTELKLACEKNGPVRNEYDIHFERVVHEGFPDLVKVTLSSETQSNPSGLIVNYAIGQYGAVVKLPVV